MTTKEKTFELLMMNEAGEWDSDGFGDGVCEPTPHPIVDAANHLWALGDEWQDARFAIGDCDGFVREIEKVVSSHQNGTMVFWGTQRQPCWVIEWQPHNGLGAYWITDANGNSGVASHDELSLTPVCE